MKKTLLLFLLLIGVSAVKAQKPIDGAMGIKFGTLIDSVTILVKEKGGKLLNSKSDRLDFTEVVFGGRPTLQVNFNFFEGKLYSIFVTFKADKAPLTMELYNDILKDLTGKYGTSNSTRKFQYPYEDNGRNVDMALRGGYAQIFDVWSINGNAIGLGVNSNLWVSILYEDGKLSDLKNKGKKPIDDYK